MGSIKIDVHKGNYEWHNVNLSSVESIKGLIKFRTRYDLLYHDTRDVYSFEDSFVDLQDQKEEIICLYADLDRMIKKANLTNRQIEILDLYMNEYTESEIAKELNITLPSVKGVINSICERILKTVNDNWKYEYAYWNIVKVPTKYKRCSKSKEWLPMTDEFYRVRSDQKGDGFYNKCKNCEK